MLKVGSVLRGGNKGISWVLLKTRRKPVGMLEEV